MSWFCDYIPDGQLILDASFLINALSCGAASGVLSAMTSPCLVEEKVFREILRHPVPGLSHNEELKALEDAGLIQKIQMTDEEYERYLSIVQAPLGQRLDAGESATIVVAQERKLVAVIDENKARAYVKRQMPSIQVVSTLKLFISSSVRLHHDQAWLGELLEKARYHGRMGVPKEEKELLRQALQVPQSGLARDRGGPAGQA